MIKNIIGFISILFGIAAGLFVGLWWAFIGGIIQTVEAFSASPIVTKDVAIGIARVVFATTLGEIIAGLFIIGGIVLIGLDFPVLKKRNKRR